MHQSHDEISHETHVFWHRVAFPHFRMGLAVENVSLWAIPFECPQNLYIVKYYDLWNCMILGLLVLKSYHNVTDRQTDRRTVPQLLPCLEQLTCSKKVMTKNYSLYHVKCKVSSTSTGCIWLSVSDTGKWTSLADVSTSLDTSCWANTQTTSTIRHCFSSVNLTMGNDVWCTLLKSCRNFLQPT